MLFPLNNIESQLRQIIPSIERDGGALRWVTADGMGELAVTLTYRSPAFTPVSAETVARLNALATLSSLVPADASGPARFVAKVGIFSTDLMAAERVYAPLLFTEAAVIAWHANRLMRGEFRANPDHSPLSMKREEPPFDDADFAALKAITDRSRYLSSLGQKHFSVEFPWDVGAAAGKTSLLQVRSVENPLYGKGILGTLELPFAPTDPASIQMANELNAWEISGADLPPHFGSWCIGDACTGICVLLPDAVLFCGPPAEPHYLDGSPAVSASGVVERFFDPAVTGAVSTTNWRPHGESNPGLHRERVMS
jgi:hypothetical protein